MLLHELLTRCDIFYRRLKWLVIQVRFFRDLIVRANDARYSYKGRLAWLDIRVKYEWIVFRQSCIGSSLDNFRLGDGSLQFQLHRRRYQLTRDATHFLVR
jgi:hypothetical protein